MVKHGELGSPSVESKIQHICAKVKLTSFFDQLRIASISAFFHRQINQTTRKLSDPQHGLWHEKVFRQAKSLLFDQLHVASRRGDRSPTCKAPGLLAVRRHESDTCELNAWDVSGISIACVAPFLGAGHTTQTVQLTQHSLNMNICEWQAAA